MAVSKAEVVVVIIVLLLVVGSQKFSEQVDADMLVFFIKWDFSKSCVLTTLLIQNLCVFGSLHSTNKTVCQNFQLMVCLYVDGEIQLYSQIAPCVLFIYNHIFVKLSLCRNGVQKVELVDHVRLTMPNLALEVITKLKQLLSKLIIHFTQLFIYLFIFPTF